MMRAYTLGILQSLSHDDKPIKDNDIVEWANKKVFVFVAGER